MLGLADPWIALQLDNAVVFFGLVVENALLERQQGGMGKEAKWEAKYTLDQLLRSDFRLPRSTANRAASGAAVTAGEQPATEDGKQIVGLLRSWAAMFRGRGVQILKR